MTAARIDHLVWATPDVDATVAEAEAALGVRPAPGGRHLGLGTRNALASFGDGSYLEIIGPGASPPSPGSARPFGIDGLEAAALTAWAVAVDDLDAAVAAARAAGWDPGDGVDLSRAAPDGTTLSWRLTMTRPELSGVVPFLIEWGATTHPSTTAPGGLQLAGFEVRHPDVEAVRAALAALSVAASVAPAPTPGLRAVLVGPSGRLHL